RRVLDARRALGAGGGLPLLGGDRGVAGPRAARRGGGRAPGGPGTAARGDDADGRHRAGSLRPRLVEVAGVRKEPAMRRRIVVEALIRAPVEVVWERTQEPALHQGWDLRFDEIRYLPERDSRGFRELDYRTRIGFGFEVRGVGRYLSSTPGARSTF